MSFKEGDLIELVEDLPAYGLKAGDGGEITHVYWDEAGVTGYYEVSFPTSTECISLQLTLTDAQLRPPSRIELKFDDVEIVVVRVNGSGHITTNLDKLFAPSRAELGSPWEDDMVQAAIDTLESVILGHACAGVDIKSDPYIEGLRTALDAIGNSYG